MLKENVQELCKEKGVSANVAEQELGFASGYIAKLNTSNPNLSKLTAMAKYFNVSLDYLVYGESKFDYENFSALRKIRNDCDLMDSLELYFSMSTDNKKRVLNYINLVGEGRI